MFMLAREAEWIVAKTVTQEDLKLLSKNKNKKERSEERRVGKECQ